MSEPESQPTGQPETPSPPEQPKPPSLTQEQITARLAREKDEGRRAAIQQFTETLGGTVEQVKAQLEEAQALKQAHQERQDAEKTELERKQSDLDKVNSALEKQKSDSEQLADQLKAEHHADRLKLRLLKAKVPLPEDAAQADEALADLAGFIRVPVGSSDEEIDAAIDGFKEKFPQLFTAPSDPVIAGTPGSVPSVKPQKPTVGKTGLEKGAQIAAEMLEKRGIRINS